MANAETVIELLKWPIAFILVAFGALLLLRKNLAVLLDRTKRVSREGLETFEPQAPQATAAPAGSAGADEFLKTFDNPLVREQEALIHKDLKDRHIDDVAGREKVLVRALAATYIRFQFEILYQSIWHSQVKSLQFINGRAEGVVPADLTPFFDEAKKQWPSFFEHYMFDQWFGYMRSQSLVTEIAGRCFISVRGREFLKYLIDTQKTGPLHG